MRNSCPATLEESSEGGFPGPTGANKEDGGEGVRGCVVDDEMEDQRD